MWPDGGCRRTLSHIITQSCHTCRHDGSQPDLWTPAKRSHPASLLTEFKERCSAIIQSIFSPSFMFSTTPSFCDISHFILSSCLIKLPPVYADTEKRALSSQERTSGRFGECCREQRHLAAQWSLEECYRRPRAAKTACSSSHSLFSASLHSRAPIPVDTTATFLQPLQRKSLCTSAPTHTAHTHTHTHLFIKQHHSKNM